MAQGNLPKTSIALPCKDDPTGASHTIRAFYEAADRPERLQFGVVDDGSEVIPFTESDLRAQLKDLDLDLRFKYQPWSGVAVARNAAARICNGTQLIITDCHTEPSAGWDTAVDFFLTRENTVFALTIADSDSGFRGYGCSLVVPFMGTRWNRSLPTASSKVAVASSAGTALLRAAFDDIGGFDEGMRIYGAIEPEFSVRSWLKGYEVRCSPEVMVFHRFKSSDEVEKHIEANRVNMVHNSLRFGACYLDEDRIMQMLRYYSVKFPDEFPVALRMLNGSDVWERREQISRECVRSFGWLCQHLRIRDHANIPVWIPLDFQGNTP